MAETTQLLNSKRDPTGINVSIKDTKEFICPACDSKEFNLRYRIRTISKLLSGGNRDGIIHITVFSCSKCNTVAEDLLPENLS